VLLAYFLSLVNYTVHENFGIFRGGLVDVYVYSVRVVSAILRKVRRGLRNA